MKRIAASVSVSEGDQIGDVKSLLLNAIERLDQGAKETDAAPDWTTLEVSSTTNYIEERTLADVVVANSVYTIINFEVRAL